MNEILKRESIVCRWFFYLKKDRNIFSNLAKVARFGIYNAAIKGKGGERVSASERRIELLDVLVERRHDNINNLAFEFGVSTATIMRDIQTLSLSYPIYTTQGNGGGVHVVDGYRGKRKYLNEMESSLLEKLASKLTGVEFETMQSILKKFKEPRRKDK